MSSLAWYPETTLNTVPTGSNYVLMALRSESLQETIDRVTAENIRSDRATPSIRGGNIAVGGSIMQDFDVVSSLPFIRHLMAASTLTGAAHSPGALAGNTAYKRGEYFTANSRTFIVLRGGTTHASVSASSVTITSAGATQELTATGTASALQIECVGLTSGLNLYSYTINPGTLMPTAGLCFEKAIVGADTNRYIQYSGCRIDSLELNIPQQAVVSANWNVLGMNSRGVLQLAASATITFDTNAANSDTVTINGKAYTFQTTLTDVDGNVKIGVDAATTAANLVAAINLAAGAGTTYATSMTAHTTVSATALSNVVTLTALVASAAGNAYTLTKSSTHLTLSGATFTGGVTGSMAGTPAIPVSRAPVNGFDSYLDINDSAYKGLTDNRFALTSASLTISNGMSGDTFTIGNRYREDIPEGTRSISGRFTLYFQNATLYDAFVAESIMPLRFSFIRAGEVLTITLPECKITGSGDPVIAGQGPMTQTFDFTAFKQDAANDIVITAINKVASFTN